VGMSNKHPILKMPLDLSQGTDEEVYKIISGFKSGVDAKNFLCSAILYYARSPLVLSANALQEKLDTVVSRMDAWIEKLKCNEASYTGLQLDAILSKLNQMSIGDVTVKNVEPTVSLSSNTVNALASLKEKFKI